MTAPDEYTAQHLEEEAALEAEEQLEGRPYEILDAKGCFGNHRWIAGARHDQEFYQSCQLVRRAPFWE